MCSEQAVHMVVSESGLKTNPCKLLKPSLYSFCSLWASSFQALAKRQALGFRVCAIVHTVGKCAYIRVHVSVAQVLKWNGLIEWPLQPVEEIQSLHRVCIHPALFQHATESRSQVSKQVS